ncbi:2-amino-4-hydroxy-6-hydroxymethyldihydropteridinepyrophosphokinase [Acinetobacter baumannii]|nr:2-amino-4-hydroxy-6-hydroxymethyldihydropteridinepyrophosphokinase [Acinetobacter baumannii]SSS41072.1 2-amino-4-hydroxy-6-hydroxymethyldihydropteridinepyrophosphokinase [Acinetobacter baumannii]SSU25234.1 2-amino-4-hydroxy-6-hydroxymethyldihydropteridinepyrophosphokinase [Acinetobacter baumannii]SSU47329.1 2-amino-4-hydroxy-6-hydroxymethyldihydropteridinepyrophosphokinase [Acinetobacter baumannii]
MQFNSKKLPLALDVKIPLYELWDCETLKADSTLYPVVNFKV